MKTIITQKPDMFTIGIAAAMASAFPETIMWDSKKMPAYDIFDIEKPDVLICHNEFVEEYFTTLLREFSDTKVILLNDTGEPTALDQRASHILTLKPYANIVVYGSGQFNKFLATDILFVSRSKNEDLERIVEKLTAKYKVKIFGGNRMKIPQYLGLLSNTQMANAFASAKVCIDSDFSRLEAAVNKTVSIVLSDEQQDPFPTRKDYEELAGMIDILLSEDKFRKGLEKDLYNYVTSERTYFHCLANCFIAMGCKEEAKQLIATLGTFL